jgi:hypothetical protein
MGNISQTGTEEFVRGSYLVQESDAQDKSTSSDFKGRMDSACADVFLPIGIGQ